MKKHFGFVIILMCVIMLVAGSTLAAYLQERGSGSSAQSMLRSAGGITVIIDPGHGGADGGAVSDNGVYESEINLAISLRLEQILAFCGVDTVMTRSSSDIEYPREADTIHKKKVYDQKTRVELVNSKSCPVLISIHQNKYTSPSPSGAQVLYGSSELSREFGIRLQEILICALDRTNRRAASQISDTIYLFSNTDCPAVMVECGFLSNPRDLDNLMTDTYRTKTAISIAAGYLEFSGIFLQFYSGGTNEA